MKRARLDIVDQEAIETMVRSRGWALFAARVGLERSRKQTTLLAEQTEIQTATLRGSITSLDMVLKIPDILVSEVKTALKGEN